MPGNQGDPIGILSQVSIGVHTEADPAADDVDLIRKGLDAHNAPFAGDPSFHPLAVMLREQDGTLVGGLLGGTYWGYLYIEILWVSERQRGHGYGHALLDAAESEALSRGCKNAYLDSHDFQAFSFYQGSGYQIVG